MVTTLALRRPPLFESGITTLDLHSIHMIMHQVAPRLQLLFCSPQIHSIRGLPLIIHRSSLVVPAADKCPMTSDKTPRHHGQNGQNSPNSVIRESLPSLFFRSIRIQSWTRTPQFRLTDWDPRKRGQNHKARGFQPRPASLAVVIPSPATPTPHSMAPIDPSILV